jgi:hypothetical protein
MFHRRTPIHKAQEISSESLSKLAKDAFLDLWSTDEIPVCEAGTKLLRVVYDGKRD